MDFKASKKYVTFMSLINLCWLFYNLKNVFIFAQKFLSNMKKLFEKKPQWKIVVSHNNQSGWTVELQKFRSQRETARWIQPTAKKLDTRTKIINHN